MCETRTIIQSTLCTDAFPGYLICRIVTMRSLFKAMYIYIYIYIRLLFRAQPFATMEIASFALSRYHCQTESTLRTWNTQLQQSDHCFLRSNVILTNVTLRKGQQALYVHISEQTYISFLRRIAGT